MDTGLTLLGALDALFFFGGILSAVLLPGWLQERHREVTRRQIAVTEALDDAFGPIVAPVVEKPLGRPWRIELSIPLGQGDAVGAIVAIVHHVFSILEGVGPSRYRILLTPKNETVRQAIASRGGRTAGRLAGKPAAA